MTARQKRLKLIFLHLQKAGVYFLQELDGASRRDWRGAEYRWWFTIEQIDVKIDELQRANRNERGRD
jgi:hypothetical protein